MEGLSRYQEKQAMVKGRKLESNRPTADDPWKNTQYEIHGGEKQALSTNERQRLNAEQKRTKGVD